MKWSKHIGLVLALGASSLVSASPVTFNFTDEHDLSTDSYEYIGSDGVSVVTATAYAEYGTPYMASGHPGIYICTQVDSERCQSDDNTAEIDGSGPNEGVLLAFGEAVNLLSATFSRVDSDDTFTLFLGGFDGELALADQDLAEGERFTTFFFDGSIIASDFAFLADDLSDDFKLRSITADYVSNVPEPASLTLLGMGLMALGSARRKKKS